MLASRFFPHTGGVERHVMEVCRELLKDGYEIQILTEQYDDCLLSQEILTLQEGNIKIVRTPFFRNRPRSLLNREYWKVWRNRFSSIWNSDVIHCHDFGVFIYWYLPFRFILFWKPIFITFHGWEGIFPPTSKTVFLRKLTSYLTRGNICIGHYIPKWYGTKADFISYGGVRLPSAKQSPDEDQKNYNDAVFIGRLAEDTGILVYLEAIKELHDSQCDLKVLICGDGPLRKQCEEFVAKHDLSVTFNGWVAEPQQFITSAKLVLTSGYLSILESMLLGKVVFSVYDNELKRDYLKLIPNSDQLLFIADTALQLAEQLRSMNNFPEKLRIKSLKGKEWAESQTWQSVSNVYQALWELKQ